MRPPFSSSAQHAHGPAFDPRQALVRHSAMLSGTLGMALDSGNRVDLLPDGPAGHRAMSDAISAARDHINLEGDLAAEQGPGHELARCLLHKRRQGVKVNLLTCDSGLPERLAEALRSAGVQIRRSTGPLRRLLVVDGKVAFTGSMHLPGPRRAGAAGRHWLARPTPWRDTPVRVEGPAVARLQQLFMAHWVEQTGQQPYLSHFFPRLAAAGGMRAAVAVDELDGAHMFYRALLGALELAQDRVCITSARFMPPRRLLQGLAQAARRGVAVKLLLPGISEGWATRQAGRSHYASLLKTGVRIFERQRTLLHAGTAVIDGLWAGVGSGHLDRHGLLHSADARLIVLDAGLGAELEGMFSDHLRHSREITLARWRQRGVGERLLQALARPLALWL